MHSFVIESRFCGPPSSGNGGYSAGCIAQALGGTVEVTLRRPPPLEQVLSVTAVDGGIEAHDAQGLVAEARRAELELELRPPPAFERALELSERYVGHQVHYFPGCFVCGPGRAPGDGLRIFPGAEPGGDVVAAAWTPDESLAGAEGFVRPEIVWAALDCPGYFAAAPPDYPLALLGRITGTIHQAVQVGERCVVSAWPLGREGRKLHAATAVFGADGKLCASARQTWIRIAS